MGKENGTEKGEKSWKRERRGKWNRKWNGTKKTTGGGRKRMGNERTREEKKKMNERGKDENERKWITKQNVNARSRKSRKEKAKETAKRK